MISNFGLLQFHYSLRKFVKGFTRQTVIGGTGVGQTALTFAVSLISECTWNPLRFSNNASTSTHRGVTSRVMALLLGRAEQESEVRQ